MPFRPGEKLTDQFEIKSVLGQGGFGCAYLAHDRNLGVPRVIKELLAGRFWDESVQKRFIHEARTMARLSQHSPYVVTVHQLLTPPLVRDYYIVMDYMAGGSLDDLLRQKGKLSIDQTVKIAVDVCRGLAQAHKLGIVHRDIKPPNILLSKDGKIVKVADFGIAHIPRTDMNTYGQPGTLDYMSVEQARANISAGRARSAGKIDGRSDLYAVGVTLFQMVTGQSYLDFKSVVDEAFKAFRRRHGLSPFDELGRLAQSDLEQARNMAILQAIIEREPRQPRQYNPAIPPALETVILKALAKDPQDRYQTAAEMIEAMQRVGEDPRVDELLEKARSASEKMKYPQALELLEQAKAIAPNDPRVYNEMASLYNLMRRHDDASRVLKEGLKISPGEPALFRDLGLTYYKMGQGRKAIEALDRSLQLDPNQSKIRGLLKKLRQEVG